MSSSRLDRFPWEILHTIYDYLNPFDLLYAFNELNSYLDTILHSYHRIQLNFKSIDKSTFYYLCEHLYPDQIQSLVLSNNEQTPKQCQLFMSLLPLIRCNNLQSITIDQIDDANLLCLMISHLENHIHLDSISIGSSSIAINKKICRSIAETLTTLSSLKYLTLMNSSPLMTLRQPLSKLTHLTIHSCVFTDLLTIFQWVPNLVYLKISVSLYNQQIPRLDYVPPHLNSLIIVSTSWMLFNELENLFSFTSSLTRFILETMGEQALLDGHRWESLIKTKLPHLKQFALNISPEENTMTGDEVLTPFQSPFWSNVKHWHMACLISGTTESCARLFSVPHFAPTDDWYPPGDGFSNYSLVPFSFNDCCKELNVSHFPTPIAISSPFKHIQTLSLSGTTDNLDQLQTIMNLSSINHLNLESSIACRPFHDLLQVASNISQLTIKHRTLVEIIDSLPNDQNVYEQIKHLNVKDIILSTDIQQIARLFPKLERISLLVKERDDILLIFDQLQYLKSSIVQWTYPLSTRLSAMDEYLQKHHICIDGTYGFFCSTLHLWNN